MKCAICEQEIQPRLDGKGHLEQAPFPPDHCMGCFVAGHELQLFLLRGRQQSVMGDWTAGWLRDILANPKKFLR